MSQERRYDEDEIRRIIGQAASEGPPRPTSAEGLTLTELQSIGNEVGLSAERIAAAAAALEVTSEAPRRNVLGMPVAVYRAVSLPRLPSDREWELIVVELRATFDAHGSDRSRGNIREWRNGNLFAYIEPLEVGGQLRLGTSKGNAAIVNGFGVVSILAGVASFLTLSATNDLVGANALLPILCSLPAAAAFGVNALRLPRWASARQAQMGRIVDRARALLSSDPAPAPGLSSGVEGS